ncbi:MAG: Uma2 family endonuclease [Propionibacteriales bacterium]|nr:Uma2 family endonuclease [Propionibacteriales bacterium]
MSGDIGVRDVAAGLDLDRRYTIADLYDLPEDGRRYELVGGWLIVSPMARRLHQVGCQQLGRLLENVVPPELFVFGLAINVDDPERTHFEPDLTVVRRDFATIENGDLPLLAVEVRSPSTAGRDAILKRSGYARLGVPSYWLFDVDVPSIRVLEWRSGEYDDVAYAEGDQALSLERPFSVTVVPADLIRV